MTDRHPSLSPAEEALLDFSLGLASELAPGVDPTEAARWRSLVQEVRVTSEVPIDPRRVASLIAAARLTAEPPTPSFWQVLEGGLRTSLLLRVVAASLVVHLCALPVLAWLHFREPERGALWIHFEEPQPVLTSDPQPELLEPIEVHLEKPPLDPADL